MEDIVIRPIESRDNADMANIIRKTLLEFGANHPGTVYYDDTTDHLFELFESTPNSRYFVAERNGKLIGGRW